MKTPKGKLVLVGGAEDRVDENTLAIAEINKHYEQYEILKSLIPRDKEAGTIEVITTASAVPEEIAQMYKDSFHDIGFDNVNTLHITNRIEANDSKFCERIAKADTVFFSGGDQFKLSTILGGTTLNASVLHKYYDDENFTVGGTSAGAMAMSKVMLYEGRAYEAMLKGEIKTSAGLGLIDNCLIDTHFVKRGRFGRLTQAILTNPACLGVGLGEDTALVVEDGNVMHCIGSGMVIIIDGCSMRHTNITEACDGEPLYVENLTTHILTKGNGFLLDKKQFIPKYTYENAG